MGSAAAYHLSRMGKRVALIEQFQLGHENGSSHGGSRIFRLSYPTPEYVKLLTPSLAEWRALESECGNELLVTTGGLDIGSLSNPFFRGCRDSLDKAGIAYQVFEPSLLKEKYPQFEAEPGMHGLFQKDAGIIRATSSVVAMAEYARAHCGEVFENTKVVDVIPDGDSIRVETADRYFNVGAVILAQGAWVGEMLWRHGAKITLVVRKEQFAFFRAHDAEPFKVGTFPIFCEYNARPGDDDIGFYGFPVFEQPGRVKLAFHQTGPETTADGRDFKLEEDRHRELVAHIERRFPGRFGEMVDWKTCLYTNTADRDFIFDFLPGSDRILVVSACSGHGFKFAPLFGKLAAQALERKLVDPALAPFSFGRFIYKECV